MAPAGRAHTEEVRAARDATPAAIRTAVAEASCLVFGLGLTEAWQDLGHGTVLPVCPGTVRGTFDAGRHVFHNHTFAEVHRDLSAALALTRAANPELRVLLTVSPIPLTATATGGHALTATTYSKSVLRAVAGQLAEEHAYVDYFPAYEIVTGFPFKTAFFEPNLRSVTPEGVAFVCAYTSHIVQLSRGESRALLDMLYDQTARTPFLHCPARWTPNTLVFWDNRCVQHHAGWDYYPHSRYGRRVAVNGQRPRA
ncbi:GSCFA domain-containing protein [Streptomyces sp. NPDC056682]|uniref:GSCFA domain-containing protein n=1 Tax=Streptomyces sp. NPDC056682 TaxID=3345909 RepID=UPI00368454A0